MKKQSLLALLALAMVSVTACKKNKNPDGPDAPTAGFDYDSAEFVDASAEAAPVATQGFAKNYSSNTEKREEILGLLEGYAMRNFLTGLVLYDDGGYVKYSDRVQIPTPELPEAQQITGNTSKRHEYVVGYGFGIMSEGKLTKPLTAEGITFPTYFHTFETEDPKTLNYMNDKGEIVGNYDAYVSASYFDARLNADKDGYEWFPSLGTEENCIEVDGKKFYRPLPVVEGAYDLSTEATKYKVYVKVGADAKYSTLTTNSTLAAFNGREIALEDYLTPFKQLWNQSNGLARGAENLTGSSSIKGSNEYYNATSAGFSQEAWDNVGIKTGTDDKGSFLTFEFNNPCTPFYAMYYISSSLNAPIPQAFLDAVGGIKVYKGFSSDLTLTPVDTVLSTGPYVVEKWESDKEFVFKKNDKFTAAQAGGENRYQIPGVHVNILAAATQDPLAAWNEYKAGKIDSAGIPKDKLAEERDTEYTQVTKGSSTTKLNVNTCTPEEWEYFFGENGTIAQTPKSDYWEVEPALSNDDFLNGLNLSLDRLTYSTNHGCTPCVNYFSDAYISEPEEGTSYNSTDTHKQALLSVYTQEQLDNYGFDPTAAIGFFKKAAEQWLADGTYKEGDEIHLEIAWQAEAQITNNGAEIKAMLEETFNDPLVCGNKLKLVIDNMAVTVWSDVYYNKMMIGQFDIGFGGISGNTMDPLNFFEVLKSDNSSGFTLNWGPNTNLTSSELHFDGMDWSFDGLWTAGDHGAVVNEKGENATTYSAALSKNVKAEDLGRDIEIKLNLSDIADVIKVELAAVVCCWYEGEEYEEVEIEDWDLEGGVLSFHVSQEVAEHYQGEIGFDLYFTITQGEAVSEAYTSLYSAFPYWVE